MELKLLFLIINLFICVQYGNSQIGIGNQYHEFYDDPYLPPSEKSKLRTKAFRINSNEFYCIQVNTDSLGMNIVNDAANEPSIAINPLNSDEIIIAWRQFDNIESNFRQAGYSYSNDGGLTWSTPGPLEPGVFRSDPVLDTDGNGTFYFHSTRLTENFDILNDLFKNSGPGEWDEGVFAFGGDKPWIVVDKIDAIPNVYSTWVYGFGTPPCNGDFIRSTNGGEDFEACQFIDAMSVVHGTLAIGKDRELYVGGRSINVGGRSSEGIRIYRALNAVQKNQTLKWDLNTVVDLKGQPRTGAPPNPVGLMGQVEIDTDVSDGPSSGNVYVLSSVNNPALLDPLDIMFARSTNQIESFDESIRINTDARDANNYQWFGTMSVAPNGRIDVVWLDTRDNPGTLLSALYYSYSEDGGSTWTENNRLSEAFDPTVGWPNQAKIGDYYDMVSTNDGAHVAWAGTFTGGQDVYYGFIPFNVTTATKDIMELKNSLNLIIYPNPSTTLPTLELSSINQLHLNINVINAKGNSILKKDFTQSGRNIISLNSIEIVPEELPSGMYYLKISSPGYVSLVKKVIII